MTNLSLGLVAKRLYAVPSVKRGSDLLISVDETLELRVELNVLAGEDVTMMLKRVNFRAHVLIIGLHGLRGETELVLLTLIRIQVIFCSATLCLQIIQIGREFPVAAQFIL